MKKRLTGCPTGLLGLATVVLALAALTACGSSDETPDTTSDSSAPATTDSPKESAPALPACDDIWQEGATLPASYEGCETGDGVEKATWYECQNGNGRYAEHNGGTAYAHEDGPVVTTAGDLATICDPAGEHAGGDAAGDRLKEFQRAAGDAPWLGEVNAVTETEPGRVTIETSLVDPRGAAGSPEAQRAIAICETGVALLQDDGVKKPYVAVSEADGTHWVLYGHPAYPNGCTEV